MSPVQHEFHSTTSSSSHIIPMAPIHNVKSVHLFLPFPGTPRYSRLCCAELVNLDTEWVKLRHATARTEGDEEVGAYKKQRSFCHVPGNTLYSTVLPLTILKPFSVATWWYIEIQQVKAVTNDPRRWVHDRHANTRSYCPDSAHLINAMPLPCRRFSDQ